MENPNLVFCEMFAWFMAKYGRTSADDREANRTTMALEGHPSQGFKHLFVRLFRGATFANLASIPFPTMTLSASAFASSTERPLCGGIQGLDHACQ
jgi:hypothetical protein